MNRRSFFRFLAAAPVGVPAVVAAAAVVPLTLRNARRFGWVRYQYRAEAMESVLVERGPLVAVQGEAVFTPMQMVTIGIRSPNIDAAIHRLSSGGINVTILPKDMG